jgi:hypothetical protein
VPYILGQARQGGLGRTDLVLSQQRVALGKLCPSGLPLVHGRLQLPHPRLTLPVLLGRAVQLRKVSAVHGAKRRKAAGANAEPSGHHAVELGILCLGREGWHTGLPAAAALDDGLPLREVIQCLQQENAVIMI